MRFMRLFSIPHVIKDIDTMKCMPNRLLPLAIAVETANNARGAAVAAIGTPAYIPGSHHRLRHAYEDAKQEYFAAGGDADILHDWINQRAQRATGARS